MSIFSVVLELIIIYHIDLIFKVLQNSHQDGANKMQKLEAHHVFFFLLFFFPLPHHIPLLPVDIDGGLLMVGLRPLVAQVFFRFL